MYGYYAYKPCAPGFVSVSRAAVISRSASPTWIKSGLLVNACDNVITASYNLLEAVVRK